MTITWLLSAALFSAVSSGSPGPNNMLLTTTGANHGFARALPHILGTGFGICIVMVGLAVFGSGLMANTTFRTTLKWAGIAYLVWLAWKIATARPKTLDDGTVTAAPPLTFPQAVLFQAANPKVWIGGISGIAAFGSALNGASALVMGVTFSVLFSLIAMPCGAIWAATGGAVGRLLRSETSLRRFNLVMALLLLVSLIPVVLSR